MIRHIVLTKFKPETSEETIKGIYDGLAALADQLPGAGGFTGGRSESPEQIERGYMHGFVIDFSDWEALQNYADNEEHKAYGGQLVANAVGGIEGILVLDIEV
ncbi:MAG: Dabb family protein [Pseudomonadota bacterium]